MALTDPLQRLMLLQMKQMNLLAKQVQPKAADPIHQALAGGGSSEASGGGSGIKGCLAREAYVKVANDLERVGAVVQANALAELGLDPANIPLGLMREYLEKRTPLADQKMLTQMGYFFAHGWEVGFRSGNRALMGYCAKGMVYVNQVATDGGRSTGLGFFGWPHQECQPLAKPAGGNQRDHRGLQAQEAMEAKEEGQGGHGFLQQDEEAAAAAQRCYE